MIETMLQALTFRIRTRIHTNSNIPSDTGRVRPDQPSKCTSNPLFEAMIASDCHIRSTVTTEGSGESQAEGLIVPGCAAQRIEDYFAEDYLQHNPNVGDGLDVVRNLAHGESRPLTYEELVLTVC